MFLLDTDFCIDWLRRKDYARKALSSTLPSDVAVSAVTVGDLMMGAYCAQLPETEARKVNAFLKPIQVLPYGKAEALHCAGVSARLRQQGQLIGTADTMIAATAGLHGLTVITKNLKHFGKIEGLEAVNWEAKPPKCPTQR